MPNILNLPKELLRRIIHYVPRFDLLSLALCQKFIYAMTNEHLKQHLALRKRYSSLNFGCFNEEYDIDTCDDTKSALLFLGHIIEDPEIAYYPTVVRMGGCFPEDEPTLDPDGFKEIIETRQAFITKHSDFLKTIIRECNFITDEEKESPPIQDLNLRREVVAMAFLLTLLPKLKSLTMQRWSVADESYHVRDLFQRVAGANLGITSLGHDRALTQLREFSIDSTREFGDSMELFGQFALLPSMRVLRGHKVAGMQFEWPRGFPPRSSQVTEVNIDHGFISGGAFEALLSGISALKKFKYYHAGSLWGGVKYDAAGIVEALRKYAGSTLQSLDLETYEELLDPEADEEDTSVEESAMQLVGSLGLFKALRSLRIENTAFQMPQHDDNTYTANEGISDKAEDEGPTMERLVDLLPRSIVSLTLIQVMDDKDIQELLRDMAVLKTERLPQLKRITFEGSDPLTPDMKRELKENGVMLKSWRVTL